MLETGSAGLPIEQREVLSLKIDGGLTFAEIAAVLGIRPNTAASRYRYALEKLRTLLDVHRDEPRPATPDLVELEDRLASRPCGELGPTCARACFLGRRAGRATDDLLATRCGRGGCGCGDSQCVDVRAPMACATIGSMR